MMLVLVIRRVIRTSLQHPALIILFIKSNTNNTICYCSCLLLWMPILPCLYYINSLIMQGDHLLKEWQQARKTCERIIEICKMTHLGIGSARGKVVNSLDRQTSRQFMDVYNIVYRLCMTKEKEENRVLMVYKDYKDLLKCAILDISPLVHKENDIYRLTNLKKIWDCYSEMQRRLNNMFSYLNRPFHIKEGKVEELDKTATNIIISTLFLENSVSEYEILYFKEIDKIRKYHDFGNQKILANLVDIFYQIHLKIIKTATNKKLRTIYTELYGRYQKNARDYYVRQYKALKELNPSEYFTEVDNIYRTEKQIAETCFVITAENIFNREFSQQLIQNYKHILLSSEYGLKFILKQGQIKILQLIVQLYLKLTKSLDGFKEQFQEHIYEEMKGFIQDCRIEISLKKSIQLYCNFVQKINRKNQELLEILNSISTIGDFASYYKSGIEKAFIHSKLPVPIEELLAIYADTRLKLQMKEEQFQEQVKNILTLFNCVQNKDLFLLKYSQRLAKRLLSISEASLHNHEIFISNLKINCGIRYTESLETIITEYRISNDNQEQLNAIATRQKLPIKLSLSVFSEGAWPSQNVLQIPIELLPREIHLAENCIKLFHNQYLGKKSLKLSALQSKIRWAYYFDQKVNNKAEVCYFQTNCLQAALLNHVYRNRPNRIPLQLFEQIVNEVSPKLIKENLNKMSEAADSILVRTGEGQEICYEFNLLMNTNKKILYFDQGSSQEQERLFQQNDLGKDRELVIDANISKLMKSKKVVDYKSLFEEVTKMIRVFVPQSRDIKLAIDRLISKEILERDEKDRELVRYKD